MYIRIYTYYWTDVRIVNQTKIYFILALKIVALNVGTCGKLDKSVIQISKPTIDAIKYIVLAPSKKLFSFNVQDNTIKELEIISKIYLNQKLEKEYRLEDIF